MNSQLLKVKIISPKKTIFEGPALSVSSINSSGKFDILGQHANFITLTVNTPIVLELSEGKKISFKFNLAIVWNHKNEVRIYTDILKEIPIEKKSLSSN